MNLSELTTEQLAAELEARKKAEAAAKSPLNETGYANNNGILFARLQDGKVMVIYNSGSIFTGENEHKNYIISEAIPCTREDFMRALENAFTKIREAVQ